MRCRHYRGKKTEGGCHSCSLSVIPASLSPTFLIGAVLMNPVSFSLLLSVIPDPDRGSSVVLFTNEKRKNGSRLLMLRMTEEGMKKTKTLDPRRRLDWIPDQSLSSRL